MDRSHLGWPFFEASHRALAESVDRWTGEQPVRRSRDREVDAVCREWVEALAAAGHLRHCVPRQFGGSAEARSRGISALVVPAEAPGRRIAERIGMIAPHPLARIELQGCRIGADALLGTEGQGFKLAMRTLDIFRASVGAAALGFARRALDLAVAHARSRRMFGATLADRELAPAKLGEMATMIDASALLVYRAAWQRDVGKTRTTQEAAMAKMAATAWAQEVIDASLQMHGAAGVMAGHLVERLYLALRTC